MHRGGVDALRADHVRDGVLRLEPQEVRRISRGVIEVGQGDRHVVVHPQTHCKIRRNRGRSDPAFGTEHSNDRARPGFPSGTCGAAPRNALDRFL